MSLSIVRYEVLETLLLHDKPVRPAQVSKETGKEFSSIMMHLIGLTRMEYATSPEKGHYAITGKGKKALGIPEITAEKAKEILMEQSQNKAFHFYSGIGKPSNLYAHSLQDFCDKIQKINVDSIEFHMNREDFEAWFTGLGDVELARKIVLLKRKNCQEKSCAEDFTKWWKNGTRH